MTALATIGALLPMLFGFEGAASFPKDWRDGHRRPDQFDAADAVHRAGIYEVLMRFRRKQAEERICCRTRNG